MTGEKFEKKFAEICEDSGVAFIAEVNGFTPKVKYLMKNLCKEVIKDEENTKKEMIDKACKSFCDTLCPNECRLKSGICPFENQFRESMKKALEG